MSVELWKTVFDWAAVVLVGFTFVAGAGALIVGRILSDRQESQIRQFDNDLTSAKGRVASLEADNLKLEAQIAPRRLDLEQQSKIAENCKGFKNLFEGKRIKLVSYSLDTEAFVFAEQIVGVLRNSGMTVDDDAMTITPTGTFTMGISVFGADSELAKKIAEAIGSSGKSVAVGFDKADPTANAMRVVFSPARPAPEATVLVGLKPLDPNSVNELKRIMGATPKPSKP